MIGLGTIDSPYIITQPSDFDFLRDNLTSYYKLGNDIDFQGASFAPIGYNSTGKQWMGSFDGDGHTISNVYIPMMTQSLRHGFFGLSQNATIKNIKFVNITSDYNGVGTNFNGGLLSSQFIGELSNIHVQGTLNVTGIVGRVGGLFGSTYETVNRLKANNIYSEVTINVSNATPYSTSLKFIGGVFGSVTNDSTNPSPNVSNIVANNKLNFINGNINSFTVGRLVAYRNFINVNYDNTYVNISNFNNNYTEPFQIVTDTTIREPLTLDTNYWIQPSGEIPLLKSFIVEEGNRVSVEVNIQYGINRVTLELSKIKYDTSLPINFKTPRIDSKRYLNTISYIEYYTNTVNVELSNKQVKNYTIDIPYGTNKVYSDRFVQVFKVTNILYGNNKVYIEVEYPTSKDIGANAIVYSICNGIIAQAIINKSISNSMENHTTTYSNSNNTDTYTIKNHTYIEVK